MRDLLDARPFDLIRSLPVESGGCWDPVAEFLTREPWWQVLDLSPADLAGAVPLPDVGLLGVAGPDGDQS